MTLSPDNMDECIHSMDPSWCVLCNGRAEREAKESVEHPHTFTAKFEGQCPVCNLPITIGQTIAWLPERPATHKECWQ